MGVPSWLYISDRLEMVMGGLGRASKGPGRSVWRCRVALCGWKDRDRGMGLMLNEDIWHLGCRREVGAGI